MGMTQEKKPCPILGGARPLTSPVEEAGGGRAGAVPVHGPLGLLEDVISHLDATADVVLREVVVLAHGIILAFRRRCCLRVWCLKPASHRSSPLRRLRSAGWHITVVVTFCH